MNSPENNNATERKKLFAAIALSALAILMVAREFLFTPSTPNRNQRTARSASARAASPTDQAPRTPSPSEIRDDPLVPPQPIRYEWPQATEPNVGRNIFAYYVPPAPTSARAGQSVAAMPSPTPPPPLLLASVSPQSVYARTGDFTLEVFGDKFTPQTRIVIGNQELPTRFLSARQMATTVPAALISTDGPRPIMVRTPDGKLYSNALTLNVLPPPTPPFTYVGLIGGKRYNDTALLQPQQGRELIRVQRGDTVGGRFRVTSITERAIELTDTQLGFKHVLPYTVIPRPADEIASPRPPFQRFRREFQQAQPAEASEAGNDENEGKPR
ncbi:IPT/TIG domain-containing protein [Pyrinomonas methylaliphatogenes]|uniref:IPT/TIG domain-containing protein n=1 Tax=Pyrinomonas methylaliphatogenes TaxID=454194 RepID=A0A0B6WW24_9BACT|nr:IPT/TIG domain-containing protein [Pyrinomonas methylaliphatogenes]CDM64355.1 hypothetical protein PYK22_00348 [Pyrinomonas methylaliphatogenes]